MAASLLDHPLLASRYFFPRRAPLENPFIVPSADGTARLACYRAAPFDGEAFTIVHFHGNAEIVADYIPVVGPILNEFGVNVVFAEYRGYGASTGAPSLAAMIDDAEAVFRAVDVPAERVIAFGRSLGSLFAVELVSRHPSIAGLIVDSGIADPLDRNLVRVTPEDLGTSQQDLEAAVTERFDQRAKVARYPGPVLVLHTAQDALVPVSHGERLASWAGGRAEDKELVVFDKGDHGTIFPANAEAYVARLKAFLARVRAH